MALRVNESLDMGGAARVLNLPAPVANAEPVRLSDLNTQVGNLQAALAGMAFIDVVPRAAATANVNTASPGAAIDGVALNNGDVVLLTAQTTNTQNGLWTFNGAAAAMTRTTVQGDAIAYQGGSVVVVGPDGTNNAKTLWVQTTDNPVVGTTALTFTQFGQAVNAGAGLTLTGNTISLTSPVAIANGGTNATSAAGARTQLGATGRYEQDFGDGSATSFAITHNLGSQYVVAAVYNKATGAKEDCAVVCNSTTQLTLSAEAWTASPPGANAYHVVVVG